MDTSSFTPYMKPSSSIASMYLFLACVSVEKQTVSSACVTSSKSAPGYLLVSKDMSAFLCTSGNMVVVTTRRT